MISNKIFAQDQNSLSFPLLIKADVYAGLSYLEPESIDCVITSPPYFGQRDYGFAGQIGNESTAEEYINKLTCIFSFLKEKLKPKGVFFLNVGDKYIQKYGFSNLGLIPFKLAKQLQDSGWHIEDIFIWYKPNHMPSSFKNRFTNTYEPIIVLAKSSFNYFSIYKNSTINFTNVIKINLQSTKYKHVAVFPEKLVESLLNLGIPGNATVLDPFAGSGTTLKAIQNLNSSFNLFESKEYNLKGIMIEANEQYIDIIINRCELFNTVNILSFPFKPYSFSFHSIENEKIIPPNIEISSLKQKRITIIIQNSEFNDYFYKLINGYYYSSLSDDGIIFLGVRSFVLDNIIKISTLVNYGWVIRNQLVINDNGTWYPVFIIVKDVKKNQYKLNIDAVRVKHKTNDIKKWDDIDFIGYRVINNFSINKINGIVIDIKDFYEDQMPKNIIIKWDNNKITNEIVRHNGYPSENSFFFLCPYCQNILDVYYNNNGQTKCSKCSNILWKDKESIPFPTLSYPPVSNNFSVEPINVDKKIIKKNYNGKFLNEKNINLGASPGARSSLQEKYFTVQRFYSFDKAIIPELIKIYMKEANISVKKLISLFPNEYKHTIGHWLRKDIGGSLPLPEDLIALQNILKFPESFITLVNSRCIVFQDVKVSHKGKNPGDYLELSQKDLISFLSKL